MIRLLTILLLLPAAGRGEEGASALPYPPSPLIERIDWDTSTVRTSGKGSDQWPMTWADDGHVYAAWGDGWGWPREPDEPKRSIGVTRMTGTPPDLDGHDLWGDGPGSGFGKPEALIAFDGSFFMFWTRGDSKNDRDDSFPATSTDGGRTWDLGESRAFPNLPHGFRVRGICQYGRGYRGNNDGFVYVYFGFSRADDLYLARVPSSNLFEPDRYEWFASITRRRLGPLVGRPRAEAARVHRSRGVVLARRDLPRLGHRSIPADQAPLRPRRRSREDGRPRLRHRRPRRSSTARPPGAPGLPSPARTRSWTIMSSSTTSSRRSFSATADGPSGWPGRAGRNTTASRSSAGGSSRLRTADASENEASRRLATLEPRAHDDHPNPLRPITESPAIWASTRSTSSRSAATRRRSVWRPWNAAASRRRPGKLILVSAITPTPAGEGKTTTSIGLAQGMRRIGSNAVLALRQPSMGPVFGRKGGATGGGASRVEPSDADQPPVHRRLPRHHRRRTTCWRRPSITACTSATPNSTPARCSGSAAWT